MCTIVRPDLLGLTGRDVISMKLIWMSDLHFQHSGEILGHDPQLRLDAAIAYINQHHSDASYCVISGDMAETATARNYADLADRLDQLAIPCLPMVGNHDDRDLLRAQFQVPDSCMDGFLQYSVDTPAGLILCLDTLKPGASEGEFCAERARWLTNTLDAAQDRAVLLFLHHPPMPLGLPMQDSARLEHGARFLEIIEGRANVRHLCVGHVHRSVTGTIRGVPFTALRSVLYQAPPPQPEWDWNSFTPSAEAPELAVVSFEQDSVTIQPLQFCPYDVGTSGRGQS